MNRTECIGASHSFAKELLSKPDGFLMATNGEVDYVVENFKRIVNETENNLVLNLRECGGNIKR